MTLTVPTESSTSIDPSSVIRLVRLFLGHHPNGSAGVQNNEQPFPPTICDFSAREQSPGPRQPRTPDTLGRSEDTADAEAPAQQHLPELSAEEAGCLLWDLSASAEQADLLCKNMLLDVAPLVLRAAYTSGSMDGQMDVRRCEIALGILGNIVCHAALAEQVAASSSVVDAVADGLLCLTDPASLSEACRLLSVAVQGPGHEAWLHAVSATDKPHIPHLCWIVENTLNTTLLNW